MYGYETILFVVESSIGHNKSGSDIVPHNYSYNTRQKPNITLQHFHLKKPIQVIFGWNIQFQLQSCNCKTNKSIVLRPNSKMYNSL